MTADLQRRLELYRDQRQLAIQLARLSSLSMVRQVLQDEALLDPSDASRLYALNTRPFSTIDCLRPREEQERWVAQTLQSTSIGSHFFLALGYRAIPWIEVHARNDQWSSELLQDIGRPSFTVMDGARTLCLAFHEAEYAYEALLISIDRDQGTTVDQSA